jgi:hypothetical protein
LWGDLRATGCSILEGISVIEAGMFWVNNGISSAQLAQFNDFNFV